MLAAETDVFSGLCMLKKQKKEKKWVFRRHQIMIYKAGGGKTKQKAFVTQKSINFYTALQNYSNKAT